MWIEIKHLWALTATPSEVDALNEMLATSDAPLGLATVQPTPEFGSPLNPTAVPTMETSSLETIYCTETHCALPSGTPVNRIEAKCGAQYNCRPVGERPTPTLRPTIKPTLTRLPTPTPEVGSNARSSTAGSQLQKLRGAQKNVSERSGVGTGRGHDRDGEGLVPANCGWMAPVVGLLSAKGATHGATEGSRRRSLAGLARVWGTLG